MIQMVCKLDRQYIFFSKLSVIETAELQFIMENIFILQSTSLCFLTFNISILWEYDHWI